MLCFISSDDVTNRVYFHLFHHWLFSSTLPVMLASCVDKEETLTFRLQHHSPHTSPHPPPLLLEGAAEKSLASKNIGGTSSSPCMQAGGTGWQPWTWAWRGCRAPWRVLIGYDVEDGVVVVCTLVGRFMFSSWQESGRRVRRDLLAAASWSSWWECLTAGDNKAHSGQGGRWRHLVCCYLVKGLINASLTLLFGWSRGDPRSRYLSLDDDDTWCSCPSRRHCFGATAGRSGRKCSGLILQRVFVRDVKSCLVDRCYD
jgi:hypothetical protein